MDVREQEQLENAIRIRCNQGDWAGAVTVALRGYGPQIFGLLMALHRSEQDTTEVFSMFTEDAWIGRFRLLGLLGQGGMGVVYLAEDETQHCQVALKVLPPSHAGDDENRRRRLLREARAMITDDGFVKVIYFGLAKRHEQPSPDGELERAKVITSLTEQGSILGTPSYMSPEQARGVAVDARSDLFSCGVVLHEVLVGQRPFVGNTPVDVISAILRDEPLPISKINPDVPIELSQIVTKCLEKLPEKRYQTAKELAENIARCLRQFNLHKNEYSPALHIPNTLVSREH